jgi:hypothetical protein
MQDRIKELVKKRQLEVTAEDLEVMNAKVQDFIRNAAVTRPTVVLFEPHAWHGQVYPAFIKYFLDLGYDVHLLVNAQEAKMDSLVNCDFPSDRFKMFPFEHFPQTQEFYEFLLNYEYLFLMTTLTHDGFHYALQLEENFLKKYNKENLYCISHELSSLKNEASTFESRMLDNDKVFVLRGGINAKGKELQFISPTDIGNIKTAPKNKKTRFISIGGVWKKNIRDFSELFDAIKSLHGEDFEVVFIGVGRVLLEPYLTPEIEKHITVLGKVPYGELYSEMEKADFILFNINEKSVDYEKYMRYGITGNYMNTVAFQVPGLVYEELGREYRLDETRAIHYTDDLYGAMKRAIEMPQQQYDQMQKSLGELKKELETKSLENMKKVFGEVLAKC